MKTKRAIKAVIFIVLALTLAACSESGGDGNNGNSNGDNGNSGTTAVTGISSLVLSSQVYTEDGKEYKGNLDIVGYAYEGARKGIFPGTGKITNGVLNYTIGTPLDSLLVSYNDIGYLFSDTKAVSNPDVKFLYFFELIPASGEFDYLIKENITNNGNEESVIYAYVDGDVILNGKEQDDIKAYSLSLKKGWNVISYKYEMSTYTTTISLGNPSSTKWTLYSVGGYTDVEYEFVGKQIKSVKLYLDGTIVPLTPQQRAMGFGSAGASHDFFEVVFKNGNSVARASWEIGQNAGISGIDKTTNNNYSSIDPASPQSSIIFVGKKSTKTLLGVGYLTHINGEPASGQVINGNTTNVTFTIAPLGTWVGFVEDNANVANNGYSVNTYRNDLGIQTGIGTFVTATGATPGGTSYTQANIANTTGRPIMSFSGVTFPLYTLPSMNTWDVTVNAIYTVGGLNVTTGAPTGTPDLTKAVRVWGTRGKSGAVSATSVNTQEAKGGLQFIKRMPAFMYQERHYEAGFLYDAYTRLTETALMADAAFTPELHIQFEMRPQSSGIFAITFQVPVYALTIRAAENTGLPVKWFIRPADGPDIHLLDNGIDSGGAVLIGTSGTSADSLDWLEIFTEGIFTVGIGFDNE
jgi:hypothetical protein